MRKLLVTYTLRYGAITAVACILFFLGLYFITKNPLSERRPDIVFNILFLFTAIYLVKKERGGYLHFYEGVSVGFMVNLFASLVTGLFLFFFLEFVDGVPFRTKVAHEIAFLIKDRVRTKEFLTDESFQVLLNSIKNAKPYQLILDELMYKQVCIVPITLLSLVLRKQRPQ